VTFSAFTTTEGCLMTAYALDVDNSYGNGLIAPTDASLPATCGGVDPCRTITLKTDAVRTYTFYIYATSYGTSTYSS
jgi:hypothetical protein